MLFPHLSLPEGATVSACGALENARASAAGTLPAQWYDQLQSSGLTLETLENQLLTEAVARTGGNLAAAARALGLTRAQLSYRLQRQQERTAHGPG